MIGRHDIVFGQKFCKEMKILLIFSTETIIWDDIRITMKISLKSKVEGVNSVDPANTHLHGFIRVVSSIHANTYDKHDYKKMIDICAHLNTEQKKLLFKLLEK